jgi:hypothetical protein
VLAACDFETSQLIDYVAERDTHKPSQVRGSYRVIEDTMVLSGK